MKKPVTPNFSSGPCAKRPGWSLEGLGSALVGRSHRSAEGVRRIKELIDRTHALLQLPKDYVIGLVPGSATGSFEMAMWSLLGAAPITALVWDVFGAVWAHDIEAQLKLPNTTIRRAEQGYLPDLEDISPDDDIVLTWNGTTTGVCLPDASWITTPRKGLVFCDATSAIMGVPMDWGRLDVISFSWQKCLAGEGAHGMLILSPRALERLRTFIPPWPIPRLMRLANAGVLRQGIWEGETINTPSMLCVEDCLDALGWAESVGGLHGLLARSRTNLRCVETWVASQDWVRFLARDPHTRSSTSICLVPTDAEFQSLTMPQQWARITKVCARLAEEQVAYDIKGHKAAVPCFRIWGGPTVETSDLEALLPWLAKVYLETA